MKTNLQIELTDQQRNHLAQLIDGKPSKREVSRKEVIAICQQHIGGLLGSADNSFEREQEDLTTPAQFNPLYDIDPADRPLMAQPNNPGYVRGWNLVKRDNRR